jgi:hypothetical protein
MPYHHYTPPESMQLLTPDYDTGQARRFNCSCGIKSLDPVDGIMHAFGELKDPTKHKVHEERFSLGMWHYDRASVATKMLEKMRRKGETVNDFAKRVTAQLNAVTAQMEQYEAKGGKW